MTPSENYLYPKLPVKLPCKLPVFKYTVGIMSVSADAKLNTETPPLSRSRGHKRRQLADSLRKMVGGMRASDRFPSVAELEKHYRVSTSTVEAAVSELQAEGLIVRRRGSGTFVADAAIPIPFFPAAPRPRTGHLVITSIGSGGVVNIFSAMAWALEAEMRRAGYDPILLFDNSAAARLAQAQKRWEAGSVDGYVHLGSLDGSVVFPPVPGVVVGEVPDEAQVHQVVVDNVGGGRRAGEYLWDLGHRRITLVSLKAMISARPRFEGLRSAVLDRGGDGSMVEMVEVPSGTEQTNTSRIENTLKALLSRGAEAPTALFFANVA